MIDLNDVWRPPAQFDLPEIRRRLAATAPGLAAGAVSQCAHGGGPQGAALCRPLGPRAARRGLLRHPSQGALCRDRL